MKTKLKYVPFAIASAIVSIIALIGTYIVYSSLNQLMNGEGDYFSALSNIGSYLFGSDFSYNDILGSMHGSLLLVLLASLIGTVINIIILLQMYHVIHISFLQPYMPSLQKQIQTVVEEAKQDEGGESQ